MASGQKGFLEDRMKICAVLWSAQIKVGGGGGGIDVAPLFIRIASSG